MNTRSRKTAVCGQHHTCSNIVSMRSFTMRQHEDGSGLSLAWLGLEVSTKCQKSEVQSTAHTRGTSSI